jgi:hypothetical protein
MAERPQESPAMTPKERLARIDAEIAAQKAVPAQKMMAEFALPKLTAAPAKKYELLADGDSWFDYPLGQDVLDYLNNYFQHPVTKLARAGSTLNELVYGPGDLLLSDPSQGTTRLTEVVKKLREQKFDAYLFSGGGNDIAGPEFFSFVNHAASRLANPNAEVLHGVVSATFQKAYEDMIDVLQMVAKQQGIKLPIFVHGYDYPWPDGRGAVALGISGPWFDPTFRKKGYPFDNNDSQQLQNRRTILNRFIDAFNAMLDTIVKKYAGVVHKVPTLGTLPNIDQWANELHPTNPGFLAIAWKFNDTLYQFLG